MAPQGSKPHDICKCPQCAPGEWIVADLITIIRDRDDVLDCLIWAAKDALVYRDSELHREKLRQALVDIGDVERIPR